MTSDRLKIARVGVEIARRIVGLFSMSVADLSQFKKTVFKKLLAELGSRTSLSPQQMDELWKLSVDSRKIAPSAAAFRTQMHLMDAVAEQDGLGEWKEGGWKEAFPDVFFATRWAAYGLPCFSLTHGLTATFLLTEPLKFDRNQFQLPFGAFVMLLPRGLVPTEELVEVKDNNIIERHSVACVHVHRYNFVSFADSDPREEMLQVRMDSSSGKCRMYETSLDNALAVSLEDDQLDGEYTIRTSIHGDSIYTVEATLRIVRNLAAWLEANGRGTPEGRPRLKGEPYGRDRDGDPIPTTWVIGREVKLGPELRRAASEIALGEKHGGPGWKLRMRHVVRGHWRNQPVGVGHKDVKRIFIEPYWRGPEGAAAWSHVYVDKGEK